MKKITLTPQQEDALRDVIFRAQQPGYGPEKPTHLDHELDAILRKINDRDQSSTVRCREAWPGRLSCPDV